MISNFEKAFNRDEFPEYFKGSGVYFTRDPDWGTQLHAINWSGLCGFLPTQKNPCSLLKRAFTKYLRSIKNTKDDASNLLENIACYYHMRKKISVLSENGFDLIRNLEAQDKEIISNALKLLKRETAISSDNLEFENYKFNIEKIARDGGPENLEVL
ncbi:hypothetical protein [Pseudomonas viridiflava]|uniref:hypothetical protein n=1 Tax=Pseudomonas viridiflava TaxID=33069 RepID=UPI000F04827D|nr:hypothetical protein [Pseudomonas viridiflava]